MSTAPPWWWEVTGFAAVMVILVSLLSLVLLGVLIVLFLQLRRSLSELSQRVQSIADRVDSVAKQVETVTTEVGARTAGIVRTVDDIAYSAFSVVERFAPLAIGVAVLLKLRQMFGRKK